MMLRLKIIQNSMQELEVSKTNYAIFKVMHILHTFYKHFNFKTIQIFGKSYADKELMLCNWNTQKSMQNCAKFT